jgi:hypothetical protein
MKPSEPVASTSRTRGIWLLVAVAGCALALAARMPDALRQPRFWHEDAIVFFAQQWESGTGVLFCPYAGYLHLVPRAVAGLTGALPLEFVPTCYVTAALLIWCAVAALIASSPLFAHPGWSAAAAIAWTLVPSGAEAFLNLTNVQWPLAVALVLLLAEDAAARPAWLKALLALAATLSGPAGLVLLPLACGRLGAHWHRTRRLDATAGAVVLGAAVQFAMLLLSERARQLHLLSPIRVLAYPVMEFFPELLGTRGTFPRDLPWRALGLVVGSLALFAMVRPSRPQVASRRTLLAGAGLLLIACVALYWLELQGTPKALADGNRYLFAPFALVVLAAFSALSFRATQSRWETGGLVALLLLASAHSLRHFQPPAHPPSYDWSALSRALEQGEPVTFGVAPLETPVTLSPRR